MNAALRHIVPVVALALSLAACTSGGPKLVATANNPASLAGDLATNPLKWKVITSETSAVDATQSTLFGNDLAVQYARANSQGNYPDGAALALVTWTQQEDPRWFGANIPNQPKSVELVMVGAPKDGHPSYTYEKYEGAPLKKAAVASPNANERAQYLLSQRAAVLP